MQLILDNTKLAKAIVSYAKARLNVKNHGHVLLCSCVVNGMISGKADNVNALVDASDYAKRSMIKWAVEHGFFTWVPKSKDREAHLVVNKETRKNNVTNDKLNDEAGFLKALGELKPYFDFDPPKEFKGWDLSKEYKRLMSQVDKYTDDTEYNQELVKIDPRLLAHLKAFNHEGALAN
jgi:hypothetical protein